MTAAAAPSTCARCDIPYEDGVPACLCLESDPPLTHSAAVVDFGAARARRASGTPQSSSSLQVVLDVEVDVGTPASGDSEFFEAFERDAQKFGATPVTLRLPDDLTPAQRRVAEDVAHVLGVYEVIDGAGVPAPYSQRFGAKRLGISHMTVRRALRGLVKRDVLIDCGETEPHRHYPRGTRLYRAGDGR